MTSSDEQALGVFEWQILREIYAAFCDRAEWHIRWNQQLYIYNDIDVVKRIKIRLQWLGDVARMDSFNSVRKVFESEQDGGSRRKEWPRQHWAKQMTNNVLLLLLYHKI